jgi:signal peptidase I
MTLKKNVKKFWNFLKKDTWQSWLVSIILIIIFIKLIFFPALSFITQTPLPLVVVESCSMYHESSFDEWWLKNSAWYENKNIDKTNFESYSFKGGLNKGDIILVTGSDHYKTGDIIIFTANTQHPLIHRIVDNNPTETKGDHNTNQLPIEKDISESAILGKATAKIPLLGWIKLIFFEPFRPASQRGFCK